VAQGPDPAQAVGNPRAVTHLGRTALPRCDLVVLGRVNRISPPIRGAEVAKVEVTEVLYPDPEPDSVTITVFGSRPGLLPPPGQSAIFLLALRPRSNNFDSVDVAPLEGDDGAARLATFRRYVEIESIEDEQGRVEALLRYLRRSVVGVERWSRWNAAREYAALSRVRPKALGPADAEALGTALRRARSPVLRDILQEALDVTGVRPPAAPRDDAHAVLAQLQSRYDAEDAGPDVRRAAVVDAASRCGKVARPLLDKALSDEAPEVREAAVAGAASVRLEELGAPLARMLATEPSAGVRRSLVRALGHLREASAVPTLAGLAAEDGDFSREACFALARIRDEEAVRRLGELGRRATTDERRELIDFLLSDAFEEQEEALGR
jgi:hypothetical protein